MSKKQIDYPAPRELKTLAGVRQREVETDANGDTVFADEAGNPLPSGVQSQRVRTKVAILTMPLVLRGLASDPAFYDKIGTHEKLKAARMSALALQIDDAITAAGDSGPLVLDEPVHARFVKVLEGHELKPETAHCFAPFIAAIVDAKDPAAPQPEEAAPAN